VDCLAFSGGRVTNLNDQGRQKGQNFPRARPQFGEFSESRPNTREGPIHPDELTDCKSLLLDAVESVQMNSSKHGHVDVHLEGWSESWQRKL